MTVGEDGLWFVDNICYPYPITNSEPVMKPSAKHLIPIIAAGLLLGLSACSDNGPKTDACQSPEKIGRFDPASDLFLAQFDIKTDTDDLHSAAAVATVLASPGFECVTYRAVSGTYGTQGGTYVDPGTIFADAFGESWVDAHGDRDAAVARLAGDVGETLKAGGHVWIMEGGQSDVSAATLRAVLREDPNAPLKHVHLVQHSDWNERVTSEAALSFVKVRTDYVKIPDGNAAGNGTPGFRTENGVAWPALLSASKVGPIWTAVQHSARAHNGSGFDDATIAAGGYDNKAIGAGGLDFSDTSEAMWIFGYESLRDEKAFVETFVTGPER